MTGLLILVAGLIAFIVWLALYRKCPECEKTACVVACDEVSKKLDQADQERVEVLMTFPDIGEAIDFVALAQTASTHSYFYRCRNGVAEVCRVVTVNG